MWIASTNYCIYLLPYDAISIDSCTLIIESYTYSCCQFAFGLFCFDNLVLHTFSLSLVLLILYLCITHTVSSICNGVQCYFRRLCGMRISDAIL